MPLFMDVHTIAGQVSEADVAGPPKQTWQYRRSMESATCATGSTRTPEKIFCLVEADSAEDAAPSIVRRTAW